MKKIARDDQRLSFHSRIQIVNGHNAASFIGCRSVNLNNTIFLVTRENGKPVMSTKHYFPETLANTLVPGALKALTTANPYLGLIESEKVVYSTQHDSSNVTVISGGGSGHEPAWSGYVGEGLLAAAACGDIFASPSTKQVMAAMKACPSSEGMILMITNYTGDKLHFGLAAERAKSERICKNIAVLPQTDDVSIGRSKSSAVGRRGMPGHVIGMLILIPWPDLIFQTNCE